ncbi:hypothetical protein PIB30_051762, partial [Stylosanthes scabra]|nr:hypothetical protein [Stylosanthes scabra]
MPSSDPPRGTRNCVDELHLDSVPDPSLAPHLGGLNDPKPLQEKGFITVVRMTANLPREGTATDVGEPTGDIRGPEIGLRPQPLTVTLRQMSSLSYHSYRSGESMVHFLAGGFHLEVLRNKRLFLSEFTTSIDNTKHPINLLAVVQKPNETTRKYIERFNAECKTIDGL